MRGRVLVIWGRHKAEYFSREIWTEVMELKGLMKLVFRRRGTLCVEGVRTELTGGWFGRLATANSALGIKCNVTAIPSGGRAWMLCDPIDEVGAVDPPHPDYFSEELIEVNIVFKLVPRPLTATMIASEMPAAIRPYSIAVAPRSSAINLATISFTSALLSDEICLPRIVFKMLRAGKFRFTGSTMAAEIGEGVPHAIRKVLKT
jgi:hypothetical protein